MFYDFKGGVAAGYSQIDHKAEIIPSGYFAIRRGKAVRIFRSQYAVIMDEMFGVVCGLNNTKQRLTVVIDKGMNSEGNYAWIDEHSRIHFITNYSTYFAQDLATVPLDRFEPVDTEKNRRYIENETPEECLLAFRTKGEYWGKERAVIVTYNPATARKQGYTFQCKIETLRQELLSMRTKVKEKDTA